MLNAHSIELSLPTAAERVGRPVKTSHSSLLVPAITWHSVVSSAATAKTPKYNHINTNGNAHYQRQHLCTDIIKAYAVVRCNEKENQQRLYEHARQHLPHAGAHICIRIRIAADIWQHIQCKLLV